MRVGVLLGQSASAACWMAMRRALIFFADEVVAGDAIFTYLQMLLPAGLDSLHWKSLTRPLASKVMLPE